MANPGRAPLHYDDAENIRKFTAQIRRVSGRPAFPSGHGEPQNGDVNGTASTVASGSNNEALAENLPTQGVFEHGDRPALHPRALQQVLDASPQLKGIRAPHPTPESHRPSPAVVADEPPQFSHEEIGQAMMQAFDSLPSTGGIEASIWAKKGPVRRNYEPKFSDIEGKRMLLRGTQGEKNNNKEEARKRSQEHNENFERMSFKIADTPSQEKTFPNKHYSQTDKDSYDPMSPDKQDEKPRTVYQPSYKEALSEGFSSGIIKSLTSPSDTLPKIMLSSGQTDSTGYRSNLAKEERRHHTGTQTVDEDYVLVPESQISPGEGFEQHGASKGSVEIDWTNVTLPADSVIEAAINHKLEHAKAAHQKALDILRSADPKVEKAKALVEMGILIGKPGAVHAINVEPNLSATVNQTATEAQQAETSSSLAKEMPKEKSPASASPEPAKAITPVTKPVKETPQSISAKAILAAGKKFAKSYTAAHGGSKARWPSKDKATDQAAPSQGFKTQPVSDTTAIPGLTVDTSALGVDKESLGPVSGQSSTAVTPSSMIFTVASPATVAEHGIAAQKPIHTEDENLEKAVYFKAWGKPTDRGGIGNEVLYPSVFGYLLTVVAVAQKRKVIIYGTPVWPVSPKPSFIAKLVFGGPLEEIRCLEHGAEVTFLSGADAQKFYEATGNGILFRDDNTGKHYAEVKLAEDVTPMSSLVQQHVDNGVTRCLLAIGVEEGLSSKDLEAMAGGKSTQQGNPVRRVESIETGINARNVRLASLISGHAD